MGVVPAEVEGAPGGERRRSALLRVLPAAAALARPVVLARQRLLEVDPGLVGLLPDGGLCRGSVVAVGAAAPGWTAAGAGAPPTSASAASAPATQGATSLALALVATASRAGSWVAVVGAPDLGLEAAAHLGVDLDRVALVPGAGRQWATVTAALLDAIDVLVLSPLGPVRATEARRLVARARERGAVLVVLPPSGGCSWRWPEPADVQLTVQRARWDGLESGAGHLRGRLVEVVAGGRRSAARPRRCHLWLPGPDGRLAVAGAEDWMAGEGRASGRDDRAASSGEDRAARSGPRPETEAVLCSPGG